MPDGHFTAPAYSNHSARMRSVMTIKYIDVDMRLSGRGKAEAQAQGMADADPRSRSRRAHRHPLNPVLYHGAQRQQEKAMMTAAHPPPSRSDAQPTATAAALARCPAGGRLPRTAAGDVHRRRLGRRPFRTRPSGARSRHRSAHRQLPRRRRRGHREAAVAAAQRAFATGPWPRLAANERAVILHRLADAIARERETLAALESLDVGKPLAQARGDVDAVVNTLRYPAALRVRRTRREPPAVANHAAYAIRVPYGPCGFIIPWNYPFLLVGWGLAPALAAGNTVVVKPAEDTSLTTLYFCRLAAEAGVPAGVFNVVTGVGEVAGAALARHPGVKRMSFTGSPEVGREVARACGLNLVPVQARARRQGRSGGAGRCRHPAHRSQALAKAITANAGQVCCTATRSLVERSILPRFPEAAVAALRAVAIGHGAADGTQMGPVVSAGKQAHPACSAIWARGRDEGATERLLHGEGWSRWRFSAAGGYYVAPSLLTGDPGNVCAREEIFGPTAFVLPFTGEDEAIGLVNRSHYGLANSVWSADISRAERVGEALVAGNTWINAHNVFPLGVPYGGCNLSGLGGGVLGPEALDDYLRPQSIVRPL